MARVLNKNENLLKISYSFKVPSARSLADRCQIRNNEICKWFNPINDVQAILLCLGVYLNSLFLACILFIVVIFKFIVILAKKIGWHHMSAPAD